MIVDTEQEYLIFFLKIEVVIDNMTRDVSNITGEFILVKTRIIHIAGAPNQNTIYRTIRKNFIGCLRNVSNFFVKSSFLL